MSGAASRFIPLVANRFSKANPMRNRSLVLARSIVCFGTFAAAATLQEGSAGGGELAETNAPAYEGAWGRSAADCANTADFFVNTLIHGARFLQYELSCTIERKDRIRVGQSVPVWLLMVDCEAEGDRIEMTARLSLDAPDRLVIETSRGTHETYGRCTGPIPQGYQSAFED